jgi:hypothetical protein
MGDHLEHIELSLDRFEVVDLRKDKMGLQNSKWK